MSKALLKKIEEAKITKSLDLRYSRITTLEIVRGLTNLEHLVVRSKAKIDLSPLEELINLKTLDLFGVKTKDISSLKKTTNLEILDIGNTQIRDLTPLSDLFNLKELLFKRTKIKTIIPLKNLTRLKKIDASYTIIIDFNSLSNLNNLEELRLEYSNVVTLDFVKNLQNIKYLDLSNTLVKDFRPLKKLKKLEKLYLTFTEISDLSVLKELRNLQTLNLQCTKIEDLSPLSNHKNLKYLNLSYTLITDLHPIKNMIKRSVIDIDDSLYFEESIIRITECPIENPPKSIIKRGKKAILNYFYQIENQGVEPIYETRLLIVGEPGAGKTSLMNKLINPTYEVCENKKEIESTIGINIHEGWEFLYKKDENINFKANLWDFGGQEIQYMTHQFFLSGRVLYVLVADNRTQNTNFPYWFEAINLFGKDQQNKQSPILVVLNENQHKSVTNYDHDGYCNRYSSTEIKCLNVDLSKTDERFEAVYLQVQNMLSDLPHIGKPLPKLWRQIREDLNKLSENYNHISDEKLKEICKKRGIDDDLSINNLNAFLHDLGVILNFQDDRNLRDFVVLNPEWAVDAVYCILKDDRIDKNAGRFDEKFLSEVWSSKYTQTEQKNLLGLMMKDNFEICYEYTKGKFIAPQFLKDLKTDFGFDNSDSLKFQFHYDFMPKGIITRLIVRLNEYIAESDGSLLMSKKNVVFGKDSCKAWVNESDFENKGEIRIEVNGVSANRREVMWWIRNEIKQIHKKWFNSLTPKQFVPCHCEECIKSTDPYFHDFEYLKKCLSKNKRNVNCQKSLNDVNVSKLIDGIYKSQEDDIFSLLHGIERQLDDLKYDIEDLNIFVRGLSNNDSDILAQVIIDKLDEFQDSLPKQIIDDWKKVSKTSAYKTDNKDKLKLTLPIIPKILVYEKELSMDTFKVFDDINNNIKDVFRGKKTIKELFIEK